MEKQKPRRLWALLVGVAVTALSMGFHLRQSADRAKAFQVARAAFWKDGFPTETGTRLEDYDVEFGQDGQHFYVSFNIRQGTHGAMWTGGFTSYSIRRSDLKIDDVVRLQ